MMKKPLCCPNKDCSKYHQPEGNWYVKNGFYHNEKSGKIQRFKCLSCGKGFSSETFSIDYRTKMKVSYKMILQHMTTSSGIRDLSRILKVSCATVLNRIARLARQAMAVTAGLTIDTIQEDVVADGIESFVRSQYMPNNITILAGKNSQFWFLSDYAQLTRKGTMTAYQKHKNEAVRKQISIGRRTIYESFQTVVNDVLFHTPPAGMTLYTDEHPQYRKVMHQRTDRERRLLRHTRIKSTEPRTVRNHLFSVNYLDREIRKDTADHTRETVQFARNVCNLMDRLAVYRFYHNFLKPYRINGKKQSNITHAIMVGIPADDIRKELKTFFTQRRFLGKAGAMNVSDRLLWCRGLFTPLKNMADFLPGYTLD